MSADEFRVGQDRAVVDRIVDDRTAVLLVGPDEAELLLPVEALPEGAGDGTWVVLEPSTDPPTVSRIDEQLTADRFEELSSRLEAIRQKRRGGRFDR